ncbi:HIT family protein [Lederbergia citri]|uniref:HIT family protein n=1 Tax=Lederbergia citri TaxID=2833580 RepID=A0A942TBN3_9BACI|nr:HIT family protein [Lederbergia citri]MBS4193554.1 HIT family protein [Lederbergia citri]
MSDCIFCKIVNGELPSAKVFENDNVLAFLDISQITKGHTLVIPKVHNENVYDLPEDTASKLFEIVPEIARAIKKEFQPVGLNVLNNNGSFAGQAVFHYHLHLIPRYDENDGFGTKYISRQSEYTGEDLQSIAQSIHKHVSK